MKPEEAIEVLKDVLITIERPTGKTRIDKAIETAIEALEKQITKQPIEKLEGKEEVIHYYDNFGGIITELETGEKHFNNPSIEEIIAKVNEIIDRVNEGGGK